MKIRLAAICVMILLVAACQKKDTTPPDASKVDMTISLPKEGQTFHSGDTVYIKANVTYLSELHGYEVKITDTADGTILYDQVQHIHTDNFVIDDMWISNANKPTAARLTIIANVNHNGESARKELNFSIIP